MKYEDQVYNAITKLGGKKQMSINFISKIFKLNKSQTKNALCRAVNPNFTMSSLIDNIDLLKNKWRLIPALVQERDKYKEYLKNEKQRLKEIERIKLTNQKQEIMEAKLALKEKSREIKEIPMFNEPHENKKMPKIKLIGQFKQ